MALPQAFMATSRISDSVKSINRSIHVCHIAPAF